jgi:hypothetical protein
MGSTLHDLEPALRDLFDTQRYGVLGTLGTHGVGLNLMSLAVSDDLRELILVTERETPKYANLLRDRRISLLVDNRSNQTADTDEALALTIDGLAEEVLGTDREPLAQRFLSRHPQLEALVRSSTCALFRVRVRRYELVQGLYDVRELRLE